MKRRSAFLLVAGFVAGVVGIASGLTMWRFRGDEAPSTRIELYNGAVSISLLDPLRVCNDKELDGALVTLCDPAFPYQGQVDAGIGTEIVVSMFDDELAARFGYHAGDASDVEGLVQELVSAYFPQLCNEILGCIPERHLTTEVGTIADQPSVHVRAGLARGGSKSLSRLVLKTDGC